MQRLVLLLITSLLALQLSAQQRLRGRLPVRLQDSEAAAQWQSLQQQEQDWFSELRTELQEKLSANEVFYLDLIERQLAEVDLELYSSNLSDTLQRVLSSPEFRRLRSTYQDAWRRYRFQKQLYEQAALASWPVDTSRMIRQEIAFYQIRPEDELLEIGAGDGSFALSLLRLGPPAQLHLNEIAPEALFALQFYRQFHPAFRISDVQIWQGSAQNPGLTGQQVDKILIRNAFHHFAYPSKMLEHLHDRLRSGGVLLLKEAFVETCTADCCTELMPQQDLLELISAYGFELQGSARLPNSPYRLLAFDKQELRQ